MRSVLSKNWFLRYDFQQIFEDCFTTHCNNSRDGHSWRTAYRSVKLLVSTQQCCLCASAGCCQTLVGNVPSNACLMSRWPTLLFFVGRSTDRSVSSQLRSTRFGAYFQRVRPATGHLGHGYRHFQTQFVGLVPSMWWSASGPLSGRRQIRPTVPTDRHGSTN